MTTPIGNNEALYSNLGLTSSAGGSKEALDQNDFLQLMTTQIRNQNPLKPLENTEFFSQIAQFSTVSGLDKLHTAFDGLASQLTSSQSLQASALIGHDVLVPGSVGYLDDDGLRGAVDVPASGNLRIDVRDASGALVRTLDLGTQAAGRIEFNWNGQDANGDALPEGQYSISAQLIGHDSSQAADTLVAGTVSSVSMAASGLTVQLAGLGEVPFGQVRQIQ